MSLKPNTTPNKTKEDVDHMNLFATEECKWLKEAFCASTENVNSYVSVIFPKYFEMRSFLLSLSEGDYYVLSQFIITGITCAVIRMKIGKNVLKFRAYAIEESDISFLFKLTQLIAYLKTKVHDEFNHLMILVGTCAGSKSSNLADACLIDEARKVDRGRMKSIRSDNSVRFEWERGVCRVSKARWLTLGGETTNCMSQHCFFDPVEIGGKYVDMETFEFFKVCEANDIHEYFCIRVVSDIYSSELTEEVLRTARRRISFKNAVALLKAELVRNKQKLVLTEDKTPDKSMTKSWKQLLAKSLNAFQSNEDKDFLQKMTLNTADVDKIFVTVPSGIFDDCNDDDEEEEEKEEEVIDGSGRVVITCSATTVGSTDKDTTSTFTDDAGRQTPPPSTVNRSSVDEKKRKASPSSGNSSKK